MRSIFNTYHPISNFPIRHVGEPSVDHVREVSGAGARGQAGDEVEVEGEVRPLAVALVPVIQHSHRDVRIRFS